MNKSFYFNFAKDIIKDKILKFINKTLDFVIPNSFSNYSSLGNYHNITSYSPTPLPIKIGEMYQIKDKDSFCLYPDKNNHPDFFNYTYSYDGDLALALNEKRTSTLSDSVYIKILLDRQIWWIPTQALVLVEK